MLSLFVRSFALALTLVSMFAVQRGAVAAQRLDVMWWNVEQ